MFLAIMFNFAMNALPTWMFKPINENPNKTTITVGENCQVIPDNSNSFFKNDKYSCK